MKLLARFHPARWTRLTKTEREINDDLRRDVLFSQILIVGITISALHFLNDLLRGNQAAFLIDGLFVALLVIFYLLNERGFHRTAKILDLTILNFMIFVLAAVLHERIRMSYNFFPLGILAFLVFYRKELWLSIIFSVFPMLLLIVLEVTDYQPFGNIAIKEEVDSVTLIINIIGSFTLLVMGLLFLVKLNVTTENELRAKEADLQKTNQELDRFVYSVSHDLRAPLSSVKGLANLMQYETKDQKLLDYVSKINNRMQDLEVFIDEIITHSRNARVEVIRESLDMAELVREVFEKLKYMDRAKQIELRTSLDCTHIVTDRSRLGVILSNLLTNSIKYSDTLKSNQWVEVTSLQQNGHYQLGVNDNGIGISDEHHNDVYKMFYRADENSAGSGLGLYIVKEMVSKLQGEITFKSARGSGTRFTIKLPTH